MKERTINTGNFNLIEYINGWILNGKQSYITKAKDREDNNGILLFIPNLSDKEINYLGD